MHSKISREYVSTGRNVLYFCRWFFIEFHTGNNKKLHWFSYRTYPISLWCLASNGVRFFDQFWRFAHQWSPSIPPMVPALPPPTYCAACCGQHSTIRTATRWPKFGLLFSMHNVYLSSLGHLCSTELRDSPASGWRQEIVFRSASSRRSMQPPPPPLLFPFPPRLPSSLYGPFRSPNLTPLLPTRTLLLPYIP